jgi:hypothetical protein
VNWKRPDRPGTNATVTLSPGPRIGKSKMVASGVPRAKVPALRAVRINQFVELRFVIE